MKKKKHEILIKVAGFWGCIFRIQKRSKYNFISLPFAENFHEECTLTDEEFEVNQREAKKFYDEHPEAPFISLPDHLHRFIFYPYVKYLGKEKDVRCNDNIKRNCDAYLYTFNYQNNTYKEIFYADQSMKADEYPILGYHFYRQLRL